MIRIELPSGFYFINYLDPEPNGSENIELQVDIVEHLKSKSIEYSLQQDNRRRYICFKDARNAVYFKMKMGEWEEKFDSPFYKWKVTMDAAAYYAPYVPLQVTSVANPFKTKSFNTRYGTYNVKYGRLNEDDE